MNAGRGVRAQAVAMPGIMEQYLPPEYRGRPKDFFTYATSFLPIAAGVAATQTIQVNTDADFLMVMANGIAREDVAAATFRANPALTVTIETTGSGRLLQNQALDWDTFFGTAQLPGILPYPKIIDGGSTISVRLTNNGADALNVRVAFNGVKIYPGNGRGR